LRVCGGQGLKTPPRHGSIRSIVINLFPAFLKLDGRRVLVVGGGPVAASKLAALQAAAAEVVVVAPDVCEPVAKAGVRVVRSIDELPRKRSDDRSS